MSDPRPTPADRTPPLGSTPPSVGGTGATPVSPGPVSTTSTTSTPTKPSTTGKPAKAGKAGKAGKPSRGGGANDPLRHSRTSGLWVAVIAAGLLLILLIIFIVQNTQAVRVDFLGWSGTPPLAVALLVATAAGILVTGLIGSMRIFQLRRRVKRATK